jgi:hypothetical protein
MEGTLVEHSSKEDIRTQAAAESRADAKALPLLRTYRENLQKEAGALGAVTRRYHTRLLILCAAAGIVGSYALWVTLRTAPPIGAWVVTVLLAISATAFAKHWNKRQRERTRHLEGLHDKMLSAGRRIEGAERRLRN